MSPTVSEMLACADSVVDEYRATKDMLEAAKCIGATAIANRMRRLGDALTLQAALELVNAYQDEVKASMEKLDGYAELVACLRGVGASLVEENLLALRTEASAHTEKPTPIAGETEKGGTE